MAWFRRWVTQQMPDHAIEVEQSRRVPVREYSEWIKNSCAQVHSARCFVTVETVGRGFSHRPMLRVFWKRLARLLVASPRLPCASTRLQSA